MLDMSEYTMQSIVSSQPPRQTGCFARLPRTRAVFLAIFDGRNCVHIVLAFVVPHILFNFPLTFSPCNCYHNSIPRPTPVVRIGCFITAGKFGTGFIHNESTLHYVYWRNESKLNALSKRLFYRREAERGARHHRKLIG